MTDATVLFTIGSFLLTVELLCLQLRSGAFSLTTELLCLQFNLFAYNVSFFKLTVGPCVSEPLQRTSSNKAQL